MSHDVDVPVGAVTAFSGPNVPQGWLVCDGRVLSKKDYPQLYEAIGELYGKGSNTGEFKLPDYRGMFLRGVDPEKTVDKDRDARKPPSDASKNANYLGSLQPGATALPVTPWQVTVEPAGEHSHTINSGGGRAVRSDTHGTVSGMDGHGNEWSRNWLACVGVGDEKSGQHTHKATVGGGDSETRPANACVQYVLKATAQPRISQHQ